MTLRYPYEVRKQSDYFEDIKEEKAPKDMLDLALHIVGTKRGDFEPEKFEDQYEDALKELLSKKQKGEKIERPREPARSNVVNLMDALRESIKAESGNERRKLRRTEHRPAAKRAGRSAARDDTMRISHGADAVRDAITHTIITLPEQLRRSLTWDQGAEMAQHARLKIDTGVQVYFCDPHSPWQRGTNENTNGLLRQYFPKGTDLSMHSAEEIAAVAAALNSRPRKTLDWKTPAEALDHLLLSDEKDGVAATV